MHLSGLDLNLLVTLDALLNEAHVGRAAERVGLSQPAVSHALARLREIFEDPLLVRTGARMVATPRAEALRRPLDLALEQIRGIFQPSTVFDPANSNRRFALRLSDHVLDLLLPPLLGRLSELAPGVSLDIGPWKGPASMTPELAGSIDFVVACAAGPFSGFSGQRLFSDTEAIVARRGHPLERRLNRLDVFCATPQVAVAGRLGAEDPVDTWLRQEGVARRVALSVPAICRPFTLPRVRTW